MMEFVHYFCGLRVIEEIMLIKLEALFYIFYFYLGNLGRYFYKK